MKLFVLLSFLPVFIHSQNLVINGSFEEYTGTYFDSHYAAISIGWNFSQNSADCYHSDFDLYATKYLKEIEYNFSTPLNYNGFQKPLTGNGYGGIYTNNEFLQTKLKTTLIKDSIYFGRFYMSLIDSSSHSSANYGMYLLKEALSKNALLKDNSMLSPAIVNCNECFLEDTVNWMSISGLYKAKGGEQFLVIGNFTLRWWEDSKEAMENGTGRYYFVDDVSLELINNKTGIASYINNDNSSQDSIYFRTNIFDIEQKYHGYLNDILVFLSDNESINIKIYGYADATGTVKRNKELSLQRALSIKQYLLKNGLAPDRIITCEMGSLLINERKVEIAFN